MPALSQAHKYNVCEPLVACTKGAPKLNVIPLVHGPSHAYRDVDIALPPHSSRVYRLRFIGVFFHVGELLVANNEGGGVESHF